MTSGSPADEAAQGPRHGESLGSSLRSLTDPSFQCRNETAACSLRLHRAILTRLRQYFCCERLLRRSFDSLLVLIEFISSAQTYGAPEILSSYEFSSFDQGAPLDSNNNALDTACFSNGWRCEQRWQAIVNMVA